LRRRLAIGARRANRATHGTSSVAHIAGGFAAWRKAGGPVEAPPSKTE
jgi:3-mercaptopyruvate sulfurtransferase SseA